MTNTIVPDLDNYKSINQHPETRVSYCTLQWRQQQLLVKPSGQLKQPYMPSLETESFLVECLKHSLVNLIRIDSKLGEEKLELWADACAQASKPIFLRIPSASKNFKQVSPVLGLLQRLVEWCIALLLLLAVSPVMLILILLMWVFSPGPVFNRQWHVGKRGRLFQPLKFRTITVNPIGNWMHKYGLENLPQLFNVLRGEMSLIGPRCCTLQDAVRLTKQQQQQLNKLPGIIGSWLLEASKVLHLDSQTL